jgi:hypothetical protein
VRLGDWATGRLGDHDLLLQIDPSAFDPSAGYISRPGPVGLRWLVAGPVITIYRGGQTYPEDPAAASPVSNIPSRGHPHATTTCDRSPDSPG